MLRHDAAVRELVINAAEVDLDDQVDVPHVIVGAVA